MASDRDAIDVIIIGAGVSGIAAATFYLDAHPNCRLLMLDEETTPGGVFNAAKSFDAFWTQTGSKAIGFSDRPLELPQGTPEYHDLFAAKHYTKYIEDYVDSHVYNGKSLRDRMVFGFTVLKAERTQEGWRISGRHRHGGEASFQSSKLIVANGLANIPFIPAFPDKEKFLGPIVHSKDFAQWSALDSPDVKNVVVLGGAKSAADMVWASVQAGKSVSWIIRESGQGPARFTSAKAVAGYRNTAEAAATRLFTSLSPSCFSPSTWWSWFLHGTRIGNSLVATIFAGTEKKSNEDANFQGREGARKGFETLHPDMSTFWSTGYAGIIQREDWWETIATKVQIYRSDISSLEEKAILLKNGSRVDADVLLCGTGWKQSMPFFDNEQLGRLGLPHDITEEPAEVAKKWAELHKEADRMVLKRFPMLASPPPFLEKPVTTTPYRLYNGIGPLEDRSVAFVGHIYLLNMFRAAEVQAIWAAAFLDGNVSLPSLEKMQEEVAFRNAFLSRRFPTYGRGGNYYHFDLIGYSDKVLGELGLYRKSKGWWKDLTESFMPADLEPVKKDYLEKYADSKDA